MSGPQQPRRALLVVNEKSRLGGELGDRAADILEQGGIALDRMPDLEPDALRDAIRQSAGKVEMVILGGGDGTLNAAAPALVETGLPLGILPMGTANDLARTLGIPADIEAAARIIADGHLRRIDLGEVNGHPFFNVASLGLSARMTGELTGEVKRRWGRLGYAVATIRALSGTRPFHAVIRHDGEVHRVRTMQIAVGNGRYYGSGMAVEAEARIDDGCLDVYSLEVDRLWKLALIWPAFRVGRHGMWREVRTIRCREVEVTTRRPRSINTDGEITTRTPALFRVRPAAIAVFAPPDGPEEAGGAPSPDGDSGDAPPTASRGGTFPGDRIRTTFAPSASLRAGATDGSTTWPIFSWTGRFGWRSPASAAPARPSSSRRSCTIS